MPLGAIVGAVLAVSVAISGISVWWAIAKTEEVGELKAKNAVAELTIKFKDVTFEKFQAAMADLEKKLIQINKESNDFMVRMTLLRSDDSRVLLDPKMPQLEKAAIFQINDRAADCMSIEHNNSLIKGANQPMPSFCADPKVKDRLDAIKKGSKS